MNMDMLTKLTTERQNQKSLQLDQMPVREILQLINEEDRLVADAVAKELPSIEQVIEKVCESFQNGGRLFYIGAGTSGRIGILDSVECPPTFSTPPEQVQAVMAGGQQAFLVAVEGAEDQEVNGRNDLSQRNLTENDVVIGIAASGRTPYVIGALKFAKEIGATAVSLASNQKSEISQYADYSIEVETGPEILTGSTRLKAATAHKMVLNMISTISMVKVGKAYKNYMVDVKASNHKLRERAKSIVAEAADVRYEEAEAVLQETEFQVKPAIVMIMTNQTYESVKLALKASNGFVKEAIQQLLKQ
ncbi:N-acetylmuramic acid 6-phosphate etherase [Allobacillus sp. SKP2-8]|nr:N-acetylmuramic acid 6-phosphate etherase [Allobacillus sp. SKP2-8]